MRDVQLYGRWIVLCRSGKYTPGDLYSHWLLDAVPPVRQLHASGPVALLRTWKMHDTDGQHRWDMDTNRKFLKNQLISASIWTAYWDATRAFMILSIIACFFGIIIGVMAFINYSSFNGFDKTFAAGILYFISCKNVNASNNKNNSNTLNYSYISKLKSLFVCVVHSRLLCAAGYGCLHWDDSQLLWKTIWELAVLVVIHNGLGFCGAHFLFRYTLCLCYVRYTLCFCS